MTAPSDLRPALRTAQASPRRHRIDLVLPLVAAGTLVVDTLHGFDGYLGRDTALYAYAGQQMADGVPPYVGVVNRAGPLAHMLPAVGVVAGRLTGKDELLCIRLFFMVLAVLCISVAYLVARDLFKSKASGIAAASAFLMFTRFIDSATNGPDEKVAMVLALLCSLWAMVHRRWLLAGVFLSVATLVLQIVFFVGMPCLAVAALTGQGGRRLRVLGLVVAGGALPVLAMVAYFASFRALDALVNGFVLINAEYTSAQSIDGDFGNLWHNLHGGYGPGVWPLVGGLVVVLTLGVGALWSRVRGLGTWARLMPALASGVVVGTVWTLHDYDGWPDALPVAALSVLGVGAVVRLLQDRLSVRAMVPVLSTFVAVSLTVAVSFSIGTRDESLVLQRASVDKLLTKLPPDVTMLSLEAPQALVLAGKTNPTRHQMFANGLRNYIDDTWPGGLDGYTRWILRTRPTVIALGITTVSLWRPGIEPTYKRVGCGAGWKWYVDRSLGHRKMQELKRINWKIRPPVSRYNCGPAPEAS